MKISSSPCGFLETEDPVANLLAKNLAAFFKSISINTMSCQFEFEEVQRQCHDHLPNASRPWTPVMNFLLFLSILLIVTFEA